MKIWYLLYGGQSEDGTGSPKLMSRTYSESVAEAFYKKHIKDNPYAIGKVVRLCGQGRSMTERLERW